MLLLFLALSASIIITNAERTLPAPSNKHNDHTPPSSDIDDVVKEPYDQWGDTEDHLQNLVSCRKDKKPGLRIGAFEYKNPTSKVVVPVGKNLTIQWFFNSNTLVSSYPRRKIQIWFKPVLIKRLEKFEIITELSPSVREFNWTVPQLPNGKYHVYLSADDKVEWAKGVCWEEGEPRPRPSAAFSIYNVGPDYDGPMVEDFGLGDSAAVGVLGDFGIIVFLLIMLVFTI